MSTTESAARYSRGAIILHWVIALLIGFQLLFGEEIGPAFRTLMKTGTASYDISALAHIGAGVLVLALGLWRIWLRVTRGAPAQPADEPRLLQITAHAVHGLLYLLIIGVPLAGLVAWFGQNREIAELHEQAKPAFIILVSLHVLAALWHQFVRRNGLLLRMRRPG